MYYVAGVILNALLGLSHKNLCEVLSLLLILEIKKLGLREVHFLQVTQLATILLRADSDPFISQITPCLSSEFSSEFSFHSE